MYVWCFDVTATGGDDEEDEDEQFANAEFEEDEQMGSVINDRLIF
jgi:hypothetical protein